MAELEVAPESTPASQPMSRSSSHSHESQIATASEPSGRVDNGYLYDSFPVYNAASARRLGGQPVGAPGKSGGSRALAPDLLRGLLMMIMAFDHASVVLHTWKHGTGTVGEVDGQVITEWNFTTAYVVRTLTHLCGSGFTFLLGMGVVYLGRSRTKLGWSPLRLARYFAVRCVVLTIVTTVFGLVMTAGKFWFMNSVLFSLAVDYLLAGLLWLAINETETRLAQFITRMRKLWGASWSDTSTATTDDSEEEEAAAQPLLCERAASRMTALESHDAYLSWSFHNAVLLILSMVTIFWNIWLSEDGGVCAADSEAMRKEPSPSISKFKAPTNVFRRIWFWVMMEPGSHIISSFPPMAWISFALLGMLYARVLVSRPWSRPALVIGHGFAAVCFAIIFVLTRVLHVGNLSEGCLQTADQRLHPHRNQYLASAASFFYVTKYTPDVAFWALTMVGNLILLAAFTAIPPRIGKRFTMLLDFGTSALFFYIVHMVVLFTAAGPAIALFGHDTGNPGPLDPGDTKGVDSLFGYFGFWAGVILLLWPICGMYSRFKSTKSADSIWRFF